MTSTINDVRNGRLCHGGRLLPLLLSMGLAAGVAQRVQAQQEPTPRVWAAQTGWNQVTLSWDEIPGAVEYRIYAGDPDAATDPAARRPISTLSGSGRHAIISLSRASGGLYLEGVGRDRRRRRKLAFNAVTPVRTAQVVTAPAEVTATVTGDTVITLSWTPVPGATAYAIGRAVRPEGLRMVCALCSTTPTYVDVQAIPGAEHSYTVSAIFPSGLSSRTLSNIVTPGAPVVVAGGTGSPGAPLPTGPTTPQSTPTTPYTPPGQSAGTTSTYTPPGQPAGTTSTYTPPGQPAGTTSTYTPPGQPASTTSPSTPPAQSTPTSQTTKLFTGMQQQLDSLGAWIAANGTPAGGLADTAKYSQVLQQLDALSRQAMLTVGNVFQTATPADSTELRQLLGSFVQQVGGIRSRVQTTLGNLLAIGSTTTTTTHSSNAVWTGPCRVDYKRADNMWAPFGKPVGTLGTETLSLLDGQSKIFVTDWKYEKLRNDGSNYYGSHLRVATNPGTRPVKLETRTPLSSGWMTLNAGDTKQFQADLVQVSCTT